MAGEELPLQQQLACLDALMQPLLAQMETHLAMLDTPGLILFTCTASNWVSGSNARTRARRGRLAPRCGHDPTGA